MSLDTFCVDGKDSANFRIKCKIVFSWINKNSDFGSASFISGHEHHKDVVVLKIMKLRQMNFPVDYN